jgi:hypothetical protein
MRTIVLIALAAVTLTGCEQAQQAQWQKAYNEKRAAALANGQTPARAPIYPAAPPQYRQASEPMVAGGGPTIIPDELENISPKHKAAPAVLKVRVEVARALGK